MSKKSHKKSIKPANAKQTAVKSVKAKAGTTTNASAKTSRGTAAASQQAPSKPLKLSATVSKVKAKKKGEEKVEENVKASGSQATDSAVIAEGDKAPNFRLPRDGGGSVSLQDFSGQKLVLFFYPKADTPGCTREAIAFTALSDEFGQTGAAVVGISADTVKAQEKFRDKHKLSVPLISDETHEMLEAYGAWGEKSMYGRKFMGIVRTTVLIGADGRIARLWRNVKVDEHADEVLAAARNL